MSLCWCFLANVHALELILALIFACMPPTCASLAYASAQARSADETEARLRAQVAEASAAYSSLVAKVKVIRRQWAKERQQLRHAAAGMGRQSAAPLMPSSEQTKLAEGSAGGESGAELASFLSEEHALMRDIKAMAQDLRHR